MPREYNPSVDGMEREMFQPVPPQQGAYRVKRPQSSRLRRKIDDTYSYFQKKVDPIISLLVTTFLSQQPMNVLDAMKMYFANMRSEEVWQKASIGDIECYVPLKPQKEYFTKDLGPILSKVVDSIASTQPQNVIDFIIEDVLPTIVPPPPPTSTESTTRNKLTDAINMAQAIAIPSDQLVVKKTIETSAQATTSVTSVTSTMHVPATGPSVEGGSSSHAGVSTNIMISLLGLGGAGKSSIIKALQGEFDPKIKPSLGFKPVSMQLRENANVTFYDLGGGKKIRDIWAEYHHDVHGAVYVFDVSLVGTELDESVAFFQTTINHEYLKGKPLLIVANKMDKEGAMSAEKLSELLRDICPNANVVGCSSAIDTTTGKHVPYGIEQPEDVDAVMAAIDPRLETALESLLDQVQGNFQGLDQRVKTDTEKKKIEEAKKRLARERKVLRNRIAMAFTDQIAPEVMPDNLPAPGPDDTFTRQEGIDFIAGEIGLEVSQLDPLAIEIIAMVGYQRLGMQIVGALKSPINKKKIPMSWEEIRSMIVEIRLELGLPENPPAPSA